jgi:peptidoglycan/LPS O-acetylase OafA/YrhL
MLSQFDYRSNGIGFLRLFFATAVVWSHAFALGGFGADPVQRLTHGALTAGLLSVGCFFVLSGFLITRSFERVESLGRYLWHRCLRIFPGFWVCLVVVALGVAPLLYLGQHGTLAGFFERPDTPWGFIFKNFLLRLNQLTVAGPYPSLAVPFDINSSLWTLAYEFYCYLAVGVGGIVGILKRKTELVLAALVSLVLIYATVCGLRGMNDTPYGILVLSLYVYFAAGVSAYLFRHRIPMRWDLAVLCALSLIAALPTPAYGLVVPPSLSYLTLFAAMKLPLRSFDRHIDLSYGVYIYAFPLQQLLAMYHLNALGVGPYFALGQIAAMLLALVSWFMVERPALQLKNYAFRSAPRA